MEDDNSEEDEVEKFSLELTATEMYSLNTILRHNIITLEDPVYRAASESLAKKAHDTMASDEFSDAMQAQFDSISEAEVAHNPDIGSSMQRGVQ